ncbi:MAG: YDG domain-containing protein, partial [Opitutaceae bacterium]
TANVLTATIAAPSKVYDGTTTAVVSDAAALQAAITAGSGTSSDGKSYSVDSVSLTGTAVGLFNSKDVGIGRTVSFSGKSLTGTGSGNYTLTQQGDDTGKTISAKAPLTVNPAAVTATSPLIAPGKITRSAERMMAGSAVSSL